MIQKIASKLGFVPKSEETSTVPSAHYADFEDLHREIIANIGEYTMTSPERIFSLIEAVKYLVRYNITGDIVECGVWKGGSLMAILQTLIKLGKTETSVVGFDTFEKGMTESTDQDVTVYGAKAPEIVADWEKTNEYPTKEKVSAYLLSSGYPANKIKLVKGDIFNTLVNEKLESISLLRLDTDWYETTKFELEHLYHKVVIGGIIIIDDYGYWKGARKAVDEFIESNKLKIYLSRIDDTARLFIKA